VSHDSCLAICSVKILRVLSEAGAPHFSTKESLGLGCQWGVPPTTNCRTVVLRHAKTGFLAFETAESAHSIVLQNLRTAYLWRVIHPSFVSFHPPFARFSSTTKEEYLRSL